jgi:transcriptional regulator with XRE-family HTH domain
MTVVKQIRKQAGLTQAELAAAAGTSQPTIAAYESGAKVPSLRTLRRLALAAGFELEIGVTPLLNREERRSLLLHRHIAERLKKDPGTVIAKARSNLDKMRRLHPSAGILDHWERILKGSHEEIIRVLTSMDEEARELRQVTPFAGVLSVEDRATAYAEFRRAEAGT